MPLAEFEPEIPAIKWLQTLGRTATGGGAHISTSYMYSAMGGGAMLENQSLRAWSEKVVTSAVDQCSANFK
jgi:hypothetical protein